MFNIIIPFFNSQSTIESSINSILNQSVDCWRLILINDGCSDEYDHLLNLFNLDLRVLYYFQHNMGVSSARNFGAGKCNDDWLIFLDADDELEKTAIADFLQFELKNKNLDIIRAGFKRIRGSKVVEFIPFENTPQSFLTGTFAIRASFFHQIGGYDPNLKFSENAELLHRIHLNNGRIGYLGKSVLRYYESESGGSKNLQNMIDSLSIILDKHSKTLTPHIKHLYHKIIGVNWMRFRNFPQARYHLWKAIQQKPYTFATWGRLVLACFPFLAKRLYSETVNYA